MCNLEGRFQLQDNIPAVGQGAMAEEGKLDRGRGGRLGRPREHGNSEEPHVEAGLHLL